MNLKFLNTEEGLRSWTFDLKSEHHWRKFTPQNPSQFLRFLDT